MRQATGHTVAMEEIVRRREYLPVSAPSFGAEEIDELLDAVRSGWVTTGPKVAELQRRLEAYVGVPHVRCLSSCTAGLELALRLAGVGAGDEVLVPTMTFVSCANVVEHVGARPVFVDCAAETGLLDLAHAGSLVGPRTVAIMPVHLGGHPFDMDALKAFGARHRLAIVEDAAHAIGARWRGRPIGAHGNPTAFSFHATKNVTTFEGGALALTDSASADRVRRLSLHGLDRSAWTRHDTPSPAGYDVLEPGFKLAMTDVAAAVGIHQLTRLDGWIERRAAIADAYDAWLAELPLALPPRPPAHARHAHHLYMVRVLDDAPLDRDALVRELHEARIGTTVHFAPIHGFTYYRERLGMAELPVAEDRARRVLSLPLHPAMDDADVEDVGRTLARLLS
jgi:dTDP-4-amino-4,6-dideoxygalactose transaminase